MPTTLGNLTAWASLLSFEQIPQRVAAYAKSQLLSQLAAARAALDHPLGEAIVRAFGEPLADEPKQCATTLAALTTCLDFDDTSYAGHLSQSTANVPIAYAKALGRDGARLLEAIVAANECAARVTAAATLGPFRGQMASGTHLAGAVAGRLKSEGAPRERWTNAFGLAFAAPPWPLRHAFFNSDAKVLTAATPVRIALDACDAAAAGLRGADDILEHSDGFLGAFAELPLPDAVDASLGERWHTETIAFKVHPGCAYLSTAIDCAIDVHHEEPCIEPAGVSDVVVRGPIFTTEMEKASSAYLDGPESRVSTLNFSVPYNVATALLYGAVTPRDFAPPRLRDPDRWALASKVLVEHDPELTREAVLATAPIGEALRQAGDRARRWLGAAGGRDGDEIASSLGAPSTTFAGSTKAIGARLVVRLADGRVLTSERGSAVGASSGEASHAELMRAKFLSCGGPATAADAIASLEELSPPELATALEDALGR